MISKKVDFSRLVHVSRISTTPLHHLCTAYIPYKKSEKVDD